MYSHDPDENSAIGVAMMKKPAGGSDNPIVEAYWNAKKKSKGFTTSTPPASKLNSRTFLLQDDKHNKFWTVEWREGQTYFDVTYGKIGSLGSFKRMMFEDVATAHTQRMRKIQEKIKKGYSEGKYSPEVKQAIQDLADLLDLVNKKSEEQVPEPEPSVFDILE